MGIHHTVAYFREEPHWLLSEPDAQAYARYLNNAMRHLPVSVAQKYVDFAALSGAVMVYTGGRVVRSMQLSGAMPSPEQQRQQQEPRGAMGGAMGGPVPPGGAQVFQFTPNPAQASPDGAAVEPELPLTEPPAA